MNQALLGAVWPFLVSAIIYARHGARASIAQLVWTPLAMGLCGIYAIVPDLPRAVHQYELYHTLARSRWTDIFLFHYTIDRIEIDSSFYPAAFAAVFLCVIVAAWRELYLRERQAA